jgi:pyruvate,orthophosphate dikinase
MYGEFLINAQGEDVVAGIRTPREISELQDIMPEVYKEFKDACDVLEEHYQDIQDIEFTIERGNLYFLQTRTAKRTADAAIKSAVDMVEEGLINETDAVLRIDPKQIEQLLHPKFDEEDLETAEQLAKGLPASPGAATGKVYFTSDAAVEASKNGEKVILVRTETSPEDIEGMVSSEGILTARGGMTSHAAVVARGMGKCCIAGCGEIKINEKEQYFLVKGQKFEQGHYISLNGSTGVVYNGKVKTTEQELTGDFAKIKAWVDERRQLKIRTNADNPMDSETAVKFGAEGIGLCRTEHMFFKDDRITSVRKMIIASNTEERKEALEELLPHQIEDFEGIFEVMEDRPVTIRLLDPPLHEFLPNEDEEIEALAEKLNTDYGTLKDKVLDLKEFNPMLGHRGCRLAITYPEIYEMQVRAIFEAAISVSKTKDKKIEPEVMIPLVGHLKEFTQLKTLVNTIAQEVMAEHDYSLKYKVGTMIEVPRAALISDKIAEEADFFSFGTNDLTQMTLGFSRDDAGKFIDSYVSQEILPYDPFKRIDFEGVGQLMEISVEKGRSTNETIKLGICGEHGGEPESVKYCHKLGLDYVSCSPFRIPTAKLAAAHVALEAKE